jgi:hypothetical protein
LRSEAILFIEDKAMAKIKSTLDLVMERTKDLALSQEDKEALQRKEWENKARGWAQLLMDRKITIDELKKEFIVESSRYSPLAGILHSELTLHIDPDGDNSLILKALTEVIGLDVRPFIDFIKDYHAQNELHRKEHQERLLSELKAKGISGSALVPNIDRDEVWLAFVKGLKDRFRQKIQAL